MDGESVPELFKWRGGRKGVGMVLCQKGRVRIDKMYEIEYHALVTVEHARDPKTA
jgi:hypothetical protein